MVLKVILFIALLCDIIRMRYQLQEEIMDAIFKNIPARVKKYLAAALAFVGIWCYWAIWFKTPGYWENLYAAYDFLMTAEDGWATTIGLWASGAMSMIMIIPLGYVVIGLMLWINSNKNRVAWECFRRFEHHREVLFLIAKF